MVQYNALILGGVSTSSFSYKLIVEDSPSLVLSDSKTAIFEHDGISGGIVQSNFQRTLVEYSYIFYAVKPSEEELYRLLTLLSKEGFWLESSAFQLTKLWCYRVKKTQAIKDKHGVYKLQVTFVCHPTKYFKTTDKQVLQADGVLRTKGSALAFPKIRIEGASRSETSFTVGSQTIRLERIAGTLVMDNNPTNPRFTTLGGSPIKWSGDFISIDAGKDSTVGVSFGAGITKLAFDIVWGWV